MADDVSNGVKSRCFSQDGTNAVQEEAGARGLEHLLVDTLLDTGYQYEIQGLHFLCSPQRCCHGLGTLSALAILGRGRNRNATA